MLSGFTEHMRGAGSDPAADTAFWKAQQANRQEAGTLRKAAMTSPRISAACTSPSMRQLIMLGGLVSGKLAC